MFKTSRIFLWENVSGKFQTNMCRWKNISWCHLLSHFNTRANLMGVPLWIWKRFKSNLPCFYWPSYENLTKMWRIVGINTYYARFLGIDVTSFFFNWPSVFFSFWGGEVSMKNYRLNVLKRNKKLLQNQPYFIFNYIVFCIRNITKLLKSKRSNEGVYKKK